MQPMVNMALRAIRSTNEQISFILDREELSFSRPEAISRVVTRVNTTIYDSLSRALQRAYPKHSIAKHGDLTGNKGQFTWHILPLHNPTSMVRGLPDWCYSVICKKDNQAEHALVIFPATGEEFSASRGNGASLNDKRLRVSNNKDIGLALLSTNILDNISEAKTKEALLDIYLELDKDAFGVRSAHCIPQQLVRVAAGKLDAALLINIDPTETAAGLLIAKEAGALTGGFDGRPTTDKSTDMICSNPKMLRVLTQRIQPPKVQPEE